MKKIMTVLIMLACTATYAQEGLEQYYQRNGVDAMPPRNTNPTNYNDINNRQDQCVNPINSYNYNDDAMGEGQRNTWNQVDPENCTNDPASCNCLNHGGGEGHFSEEPVYRGNECVPVQVYDWDGGEKVWFESGQDPEYPRYWCEDKPVKRRNNRGKKGDTYYIEQQDDALDNGYRGEDYYKTQIPEAGYPYPEEKKEDDALGGRGGLNRG